MKFTKKELKNLRKLSDSVKATTFSRSQKQIKDSKVKDDEMVKFPDYPRIDLAHPSMLSSTLKHVTKAVIHKDFATAKKELEIAKGLQKSYLKELNSFKNFVKEYEKSLNKADALVKDLNTRIVKEGK